MPQLMHMSQTFAQGVVCSVAALEVHLSSPQCDDGSCGVDDVLHALRAMQLRQTVFDAAVGMVHCMLWQHSAWGNHVWQLGVLC